MTSAEEGMRVDESDEQHSNPQRPIWEMIP
jgi:hypothetical protein